MQTVLRRKSIRNSCWLHYPNSIDSVPWYRCYSEGMEKLTIGKLAELAGVGVETIRFYQRKELLREPKATTGFRTYAEEDAQRIIFIKKAQDLGFTLSEVKELLELNTKPRVTCGNVKIKTTMKIKEIDEKIANLERMRASLEKLAMACDASQDKIRQFKVQECFDDGLNCKC